ncbi:MAG: dienelactone hydrolase family protein [Nannocystaceae bacterium]|nr:dienelactone hydrolase family protein [bacterium]
MSETTSIDVGGRQYDAAISRPEGDGPWPAVVVLHDLTGFGNDVRRHCDRFAEAGYLALAPDLYRGGNVACIVQTLKSIATNEGHAFAVVDGARRAVMERSDVDSARVAICGFCMGGGFALVAAADQAFAVAAPFYGSVPRSASRLRGICPTIAQFGTRDSAFVSHGHRLSEHLQELGVEHEVLFHEGAGHSFMNQLEGLAAVGGPYTPLRAEYDPQTEAVAWAKLLDFFERHLPAAPES